MVEQYLEVLWDPESFFERDEEASNIVVPIGVMVFVGLLSGVAGWFSYQQTSQLMGGQGAGGAGFAVIMGIVSIVVGLVVPFIAWLLYAGLFHLISGALGGDGEFKTTLVYTGWGFLPKVFGSVVGLASTWYVLQVVPLPTGVDPQNPQAMQQAMQSYQQAVQSHPATLAAFVVGLLVLAWSAYIWVGAVQHARDLDRADAAIAVGIPVAIALIIRLGSRFLL